ncbi:hypothetical protein EVAR_99771_1 [Eumeta japonica]|uniref:Uncharacterized protein n=1 Tax=Eumeta variegata TaxID=151549 RepID=A0A4C1ZMM7_EUMVA|nr:hypothetical protein EVAR_99771_1 [Eumeta japonica]
MLATDAVVNISYLFANVHTALNTSPSPTTINNRSQAASAAAGTWMGDRLGTNDARVTCNVIECHQVRRRLVPRLGLEQTRALRYMRLDLPVRPLTPGRQNTGGSRHALRHPIRDPLKNLSSLFPKILAQRETSKRDVFRSTSNDTELVYAVNNNRTLMDQRAQTLSPPRRSGVDRGLLTTIITNTLTTASNDEELMCS